MTTPTPRRGEVWLVDFNPQVGAEIAKARPAVVLNLDHVGRLPLRIVAPLTDVASGARETIAARYLAGCDGAGSTVRRALGIGLEGKGLLGHAVNMFFRAPGLATRETPGRTSAPPWPLTRQGGSRGERTSSLRGWPPADPCIRL